MNIERHSLDRIPSHSNPFNVVSKIDEDDVLKKILK